MPNNESRLIIGWNVDENKAPQYWFKKGAKPGGQAETDLVYAPGESMAHHTAIMAQSGSGKSFFLGRVIEELVLRTKARCLVFDPNADFTRMSDIADPALWTNAEYDPQTGRGRLPHESSRDEFERDWRKVAIRVWTAGKVPKNSDTHKPLKIPVSQLSAEFLAEDLDPRHRSDIYLCQEMMGQLERLYQVERFHPTTASSDSGINLVEKLQILLDYAKNARYGRALFDKEFPSSDLKGLKTTAPSSIEALSYLWNILGVRHSMFSKLVAEASTALLKDLRENFFEGLLRLANDVPSEVLQYYISRLEFLHSSGILERGLVSTDAPIADIEIVDLPSLSVRDIRLLAVDYLLGSRWARARQEWLIAMTKPVEEDTRVPTFVVVDEAHNLIAREPRSLAERVVRERFRTIAAEGRKLGMFLIVVSQNPTKLDSFVLSECENRALMRLNSEAVLELAKKDLGLDHLSPSTLQACLRLGMGRALVEGPWSPQGPTFLFSAARRTVEGGRNLRPSHWAAPPNRPDKPKKEVKAEKSLSTVPEKPVPKIIKGADKETKDKPKGDSTP